jgi:nitrogen PTS system EIIA component
MLGGLMQDVLTLKQLADHLQLSERTVYRLLDRGELPGFKVGGHWRFRRAVVDYWMDLRMGRMSPAELRHMEEEWRGPALSLSDGLVVENALLPLPIGSRREIIAALIRSVTFPEPVATDVILERVWEREELASTATADGVAILHTARWVPRTIRRGDLLAIGRLPAAVDFGALGGGLTDLLFLLLARDARQHLILLAKTARLCRHPGFLSAVRTAHSASTVVTLVRNTERLLFADAASPPS